MHDEDKCYIQNVWRYTTTLAVASYRSRRIVSFMVSLQSERLGWHRLGFDEEPKTRSA